MNKEIRAFYTKDTIRVYQAYNKIIASEAVQKGTFGDSFKRERMSWIKPSFLWMMYRSIQLGLRGDAVRKYINEWIVNITDITDYVKDLKEKIDHGIDIKDLLPKETQYTI